MSKPAVDGLLPKDRTGLEPREGLTYRPPGAPPESRIPYDDMPLGHQVTTDQAQYVDE